MNRDQYLQKKGWRSPPMVRPVSSPQAELAAACASVPAGVRIVMATATRDSPPALRQKLVLTGAKG